MDRLYTAGFTLSLTTGHEPCPLCGCRFGSHLTLVPADTTAENLLDRIGWIECDTCDQGCGSWGVYFHRLT